MAAPRPTAEECDRRGDAHYRVSLRDYVEAEILALHKEIELRFTALEMARLATVQQVTLAQSKSEENLGYRLDSMNEFRSQLTDQAKTFLSKDEYRAAYETIVSKIEYNTGRLDKLEGAKAAATETRDNSRANVAILIACIAGLGSIAIDIITLILQKH